MIHAARIAKMRSASNILVGKAEGRLSGEKGANIKTADEDI